MPRVRLTETKSWEEICEKIMAEANLKTPGFKKWLMSKENLNGVFFDSLMWRRLYGVWDKVNNQDYDHFWVNSGVEGEGKTTLSIQQACVLDPTWSLNKLLYNPTDFIDKIKYSKKGDCLVLDEGNLFLFSREAMKDSNVFMVKLFALVRAKNLIVIINVPNFFTLDTYVRDHRTRTLLYIRSRGKYSCYRKKAIRLISHYGKATKQIAGVIVPATTVFKGWFNKYYPATIDENEYRKFKEKNFNIFIDDIKQTLAKRTKQSEFVSLQEAKTIVPLKNESFVRLIEKGELEGKKVGMKWFIRRKSLENTAKTKDLGAN